MGYSDKAWYVGSSALKYYPCVLLLLMRIAHIKYLICIFYQRPKAVHPVYSVVWFTDPFSQHFSPQLSPCFQPQDISYPGYDMSCGWNPQLLSLLGIAVLVHKAKKKLYWSNRPLKNRVGWADFF